MNSNSATAPRRRAPELKRSRIADCGFKKRAIRNPQSAIRNPQSATNYAKLTRPKTAGARRQKHAADHEGDEDGRRGQASPRAGARGRRAPLHAEDDADSGRRGPPSA